MRSRCSCTNGSTNPAGVLSYGGVSGGLRSAQVLRQLLSNVNVHALPQVVPVRFVLLSSSITACSVRANRSRTELNGLLDELHKWARPLSSLRAEQAADRAVQNAAA